MLSLGEMSATGQAFAAQKSQRMFFAERSGLGALARCADFFLQYTGDLRSENPTCPYTNISATIVALDTSRSYLPRIPGSRAQNARASGIPCSFPCLAPPRQPPGKTVRRMLPP